MMKSCTPKTVFLKLSDKGNMVEIQRDTAEKERETFGGLLRSHPDIDCEIIADGQDIEMSFVWDREISLTAECEAEYKGLLESKYEVLPNGNIEIFTDNYDEADRFFRSSAGYCPNSEYERLFVWKD